MCIAGTARIDEYVPFDRAVNWMKVDVEGGELAALRSAGKLFAGGNSGPEVVYVELTWGSGVGESAADTVAFLKDKGYSFFVINDEGLEWDCRESTRDCGVPRTDDGVGWIDEFVALNEVCGAALCQAELVAVRGDLGARFENIVATAAAWLRVVDDKEDLFTVTVFVNGKAYLMDVPDDLEAVEIRKAVVEDICVPEALPDHECARLCEQVFKQIAA